MLTVYGNFHAHDEARTCDASACDAINPEWIQVYSILIPSSFVHPLFLPSLHSFFALQVPRPGPRQKEAGGYLVDPGKGEPWSVVDRVELRTAFKVNES